MSYDKSDKTYNGYIYLITNLINNMKYVGLTSTTVQSRWRRHVNITKQRAEKDFCLIDIKIKEFGEENFKVETLAIVSSNNEQDLWDDMNKLEREYISYYDTLWKGGYGNGYNIDEGGNSGTINNKPVIAYDIHGNFIAKFKSRLEASIYFDISDDIIVSICAGKKPSYKSKYVFRNEGDPFNMFDITNHRMYRDIYQFTLDGNFVANYKSCQEVPYDFRWRIYEVINNPYKTCGGYWWSSDNNFNYICNRNNKSVSKYSLDGNLIQTFISASECARYEKVALSCILDCCNGRQKTTNGYVFRYANDSFDKYDIMPKKNKNIKKVNKYTLDDILLESFDSLADACRSVNAKTMSQINGCCLHRKNCKTAYGFKWFYEDDITQPNKQ